MPAPQVLKEASAWANSALEDSDSIAVLELVEAASSGDSSANSMLLQMFAGPVRFGTAGLRAAMGPGESQMNTSVVARASWGFAQWLLAQKASSISVAFDARRNSEEFAKVAAQVFSAAGLNVALSRRAVPTPVLAFSVRHLKADAGVMITASHNPRNDNGYKVYLADGSQIAPPVDTQISARIDIAPPANLIPRNELLITGWSPDLMDSYTATAARVVHGIDHELWRGAETTWVYTPMHGVGLDALVSVLDAAHMPRPNVVESQAAPDGAFPTLPFPNPEESGALDLAFSTAAAVGADLLVANDPDADRCALAVASAEGWRQLTGDELGALLAWWQIHVRNSEITTDVRPVLATTLVSSTMIREIALANDYGFVTTLTGFKWISRVNGLSFGYEEALGYCVDPNNVRDKDGITAAIAVLSLYFYAKQKNKSLLDLLDDIYVEHGLHFTDTRSTRLASTEQASQMVAALAVSPPSEIGGFRVENFEDLARGVDGLPPTSGVRFWVGGNVRVIIRPSGTEPKVKTYLEIVKSTSQERLTADKTQAKALAEEIHQALAESVLCPAP